MDDIRSCDTCGTALDESGTCVTCHAVSQGLVPIMRSGYAEVRKQLDLLEAQGLQPEIEKVPPGRPMEKLHPLWNLYVPTSEVSRARQLLQGDWAELLDDPEAARAAERGLRGVDLDKGGEIECPACGHKFELSKSNPECPDCGLSLGSASDSSPDEAETN